MPFAGAEIRDAVARQHLQDEQLEQRAAAAEAATQAAVRQQSVAAAADDDSTAAAAGGAEAGFVKPPPLSSKPAPGTLVQASGTDCHHHMKSIPLLSRAPAAALVLPYAPR